VIQIPNANAATTVSLTYAMALISGNVSKPVLAGKTVIFDREEWQTAWETNRVAYLGSDGKHAFFDD
jgi:hypothetical protein